MKRSGQVRLVLMGAATFVATFAAGTAYFAWQKPSHAAEGVQAAQSTQAAQSCAQQPDDAKNCEPARRGFAYYFYPRYFHGWSWSSSTEPVKREVALTGNSRSLTPASSTGVVRSGFGTTARSAPFRMSAGG